MTSIEKLAKLFNERNNPYVINVTTGIVKSTSPIAISWGDDILLKDKDLIIASLLKNGFSVDGHTIVNSLSAGDEVIMIPDNDFKKFYVIDKVG